MVVMCGEDVMRNLWRESVTAATQDVIALITENVKKGKLLDKGFVIGEYRQSKK